MAWVPCGSRGHSWTRARRREIAASAPEPDPALAGPRRRPRTGPRRRGAARAGAVLRDGPSAVVLRAFFAGWAATRDEPPTSLNDPVGPGRRLSLVRLDQREVRRVAQAHDAAINDVVLALVAGGVRDLLAARGEPIDRLTVRAGIAVTLPPSERRGDGANQFGSYAIPLPILEPDPARPDPRHRGRVRARPTHAARHRHDRRARPGGSLPS